MITYNIIVKIDDYIFNKNQGIIIINICDTYNQRQEVNISRLKYNNKFKKEHKINPMIFNFSIEFVILYYIICYS